MEGAGDRVRWMDQECKDNLEHGFLGITITKKHFLLWAGSYISSDLEWMDEMEGEETARAEKNGNLMRP